MGKEKKVEMETVVAEVVLPENNTITKWSAQDKRTYKSLQNSITKEYGQVEKSSLNIAFYLHDIYQSKFYEIDGYKNIYDFAFEKFNIARGTCNNFVNIVRNFGKRDESGKILRELKDGFEEFSFSQLIILLGIEDNQLPFFKPSMTIREMKAEKKRLDNISDSLETDTNESNVNTTGEITGETAGETAKETTEESDFLNSPVCNVITFSNLNDFEKKCKLSKELLSILQDTLESFTNETGKTPNIEICLTV